MFFAILKVIKNIFRRSGEKLLKFGRKLKNCGGILIVL